MTDSPLPFATRLWLCWVCWFRVLTDGAFARRVRAASRSQPALSEPTPTAAPETTPTVAPESPAAASRDQVREGALQVIALLQREGRLVDFLQQDVATFADADVGAAARVVHEGCRRALRAHAKVVSVRPESEGAPVSVSPEEIAQVKLLGNVKGAAPYRGVLRHRGWRVESLKLPEYVGAQDPALIAPAEVELS